MCVAPPKILVARQLPGKPKIRQRQQADKSKNSTRTHIYETQGRRNLLKATFNFLFLVAHLSLGDFPLYLCSSRKLLSSPSVFMHM